MTVSPGTKLGPYEIFALIGAGGMGEVYRARDTRLDRTVAVKILPETSFRKSRLKATVRTRGAHHFQSFSSLYICALHDIGTSGRN